MSPNSLVVYSLAVLEVMHVGEIRIMSSDVIFLTLCQGEFQHKYYVIVSLHHGDHDGVVRISVHLSCVLWGLII